MTLGPHGAQVLPAFLAGADRGEHNGLDGARVRRAARAVDLALVVGADVALRPPVLVASGRRLGGVRGSLTGVLFQEHEHRDQQHLDQGAALGRDLPVTGQLLEAAPEGLKLLAQGLPVDARHESKQRRLLAGLHRYQPRQDRRALHRWHRRIAACPPGSSPAAQGSASRQALHHDVRPQTSTYAVYSIANKGLREKQAHQPGESVAMQEATSGARPALGYRRTRRQ